MADKTTIINRALSTLGAEPITDITDPTREAQIASRYYDESRKAILSECLWNFAAKRESLNVVVDTPAWTENSMNNYFQLPSDVIRIFRASPDGAFWRQEGDRILSNTTDFGILYVYDTEDTSKFPASFVDAFADKLAADMCYVMLNSNTEAERIQKKYEGSSLPRAMAENSQVGSPYPIDDNLWSYAKYGFTPVNSTGIRIG